MIPLRDSTKSKTTPYVNYTLIAINILVFVYQITLNNQQLINFIQAFGVIPAKYPLQTLPFKIIADPLSLFPFVSATFIHGGLVHILGNMLYLWVFGDNIEDRFGHFKYLIFYFVVAFAAHFAHILTNLGSTVPTIGASGAVAGVLGAYFLAYPGAKVLALIPLGFFITISEVPAIIFLFLWFFLQLLNGLTALGLAGAQTVAWWAHIGGFLSGVLIYQIFKKNDLYT